MKFLNASALLLALSSTALFALPAMAADGYPRVSVGGYLETAYEIESFGNNAYEPPDTFNFLSRTPVHIGQVKLLANYELSDTVDGMIEVFPWPKGNPEEYAGEYKDIVGNDAPSPFTVSGRIQTSIHELFGSSSTLTLGQIRVPFGIWDDFSVHRKFFDTTSDTGVFLGSPLRRIDFGAQLDGDVLPNGAMTYRVATVQRADNPSTVNNYRWSDYVVRLGSRGDWGDVGVNAYIPDVKDAPLGQKGALGLDYTFYLPANLSLIGEYVDQDDLSRNLYSRGVYARLNYDMSDMVPGLRTFVGYEHTSDNTNPDYPLENKGIVGFRYRFMSGLTLGMDFFQGQEYPDGHLHIRLETQF